MESERQNLVYMAKVAEQAKLYDEMVENLKKVAKLDLELTMEEKDLLSVGYKKALDSRLASWRIMSSVEQKEESKGNGQCVQMIKGYRRKVEEELFGISNDILTIVDEHLIPSSTSGESTAFYHMMKGDCYRSLAEFTVDQERRDAYDKSLESYQAASHIANMDLRSTHPIRLSLAQKLSVYFYEILNSPERACQLAKTPLDEATIELDTSSEDSYRDNTAIRQLLRENLTLRTSDLSGDGGLYGSIVDKSKTATLRTAPPEPEKISEEASSSLDVEKQILYYTLKAITDDYKKKMGCSEMSLQDFKNLVSAHIKGRVEITPGIRAELDKPVG